VKGRHQTDLIWRFQVADTQMAGVPSVLAIQEKHWLTNGAQTSHVETGVCAVDMNIMARERSERIDRILERLPDKPVSLSRVLYLRYGPEENSASLCEVLPSMAGIAALTAAAKKACERANGKPPRPRSNDALHWLEHLCTRVSHRATRGDDKAVLADVQYEADELLVVAEDTYEGWASVRPVAA
jgi:hypothetical protein